MPEKRIGHINSINGNMVSVAFKTFVVQNEVAYIICGDERLKSEVCAPNPPNFRFMKALKA
jgi:hypothetical protein